LDYLAQDTAHLTVPLLRAACDVVARDAKGLPYASEIITAATQLVEERQRVRRDETRVNGDGEIQDGEYRPGEVTPENAERCRAMNMRLISSDAPYRVVPLGAESAYRVHVADDGTVVPNYVCDGRGGVSHKLGGKDARWSA